MLTPSQHGSRRHASRRRPRVQTDNCANCGSAYQTSTDPERYDPWCSAECYEATLGRF